MQSDRFGPPPAHWAGICRSGENWSSANCNNKVIGARWFASGITSAQDLVEGEFLSAYDSDGHGTHTASTAGGKRSGDQDRDTCQLSPRGDS